MIQIRTFGALELRRDGAHAGSVLSQPKRLAVLLYLRIAVPGGFIARDRVLAQFWPESDDARARNTLRQALHFLRRSLGDDAIVSRGEREIGADPGIECDATAFRDALAAGRLEHALELYRGEFLPGFFVEDAPEIEQWIEAERSELARLAARAAWTLSERDAERSELKAAVLWARRGLAIEPFDEDGVRRLISLLARIGDRPAALDVYHDFEKRLVRDLDLEPAAETIRLAKEIRAGTVVGEVPVPSEQPNAVVLTPAHVVTPPQVVTPSPAAAALPTAVEVRPKRAQRVVTAAMAAVLALATLLGAFLVIQSKVPAPLEGPPAIAVMPFVDMSEDASAAYFADGVSEELLNVLARVPGLRVAARTSSFAFRDKDVPVDSIARALNVTHVLEGSVRTSDQRVRITAQLIETKSGYHVWSETYDRKLDDIFAVQDEIAAAIAKKLQIELAGNFWGVSEGETRDTEAYRLVLRALHTFRGTPSPESYATSAALLQDALRRDPNYARAYGALANVMLWQASFGFIPRDYAYARADSLARRGLAIAETPEAHLALARLAEVLAWKPDSADAHFRRALELNPADARTLQYRALFLARSNRGDEAIAAAKRATELDPLHPGSWVNYSSVLSMLSREEEAVPVLEKANTIAPNDIIVLINLANQYGNVGRIDDALATTARALAIDSMNLTLQGLRVHLLFQAKRTTEARSALSKLEKNPDFPRFRLAALYANTQDTERVLDLLEESAARKEDELSRVRAPDMFRGLRQHPRFIKLLESLDTSGNR